MPGPDELLEVRDPRTDELVGRVPLCGPAEVEAALAAGLGWPEIAAALGVTRQAAHKKFSRRVSTELRRPRRTETR